MKRREFVILGAVAAAVPLAAHAGDGVGVAYETGLVEAALADGKTVMLDFYTTWCGTCDRQERIVKGLQAENPAYEQQITFIKVDWDEHSRSDLALRLRIPRRSTLVVLKGKSEIGRLVADTRPENIKALMESALSAPS